MSALIANKSLFQDVFNRDHQLSTGREPRYLKTIRQMIVKIDKMAAKSVVEFITKNKQ